MAGRRPGQPGRAARGVALASADATALPLRDGVADLALAPHMLYHVPDPADALRELRRVTRPGGRVVIVLNGAGHLRELRAAVAAASATTRGHAASASPSTTASPWRDPSSPRSPGTSRGRAPRTGAGADRGLRALIARHSRGADPEPRRDRRRHLPGTPRATT